MLSKANSVSHLCRQQATVWKQGHQIPSLTATEAEPQRERRNCSFHKGVTIWAAHSLCRSAKPAVTPPQRRAAHWHPAAAWGRGGWLCTKHHALICHVFPLSARASHSRCGSRKQQVLLSNLCLCLFNSCPTVISITWHHHFRSRSRLVTGSQLQKDLRWSLLATASGHCALCCDPTVANRYVWFRHWHGHWRSFEILRQEMLFSMPENENEW